MSHKLVQGRKIWTFHLGHKMRFLLLRWHYPHERPKFSFDVVFCCFWIEQPSTITNVVLKKVDYRLGLGSDPWNQCHSNFWTLKFDAFVWSCNTARFLHVKQIVVSKKLPTGDIKRLMDQASSLLCSAFPAQLLIKSQKGARIDF